MNGIGQAAFYRGYLTDERSLVPLTIVLVSVVALWLFVYLVATVAEVPARRRRLARRPVTIRDRRAASLPIGRDASARR